MKKRCTKFVHLFLLTKIKFKAKGVSGTLSKEDNEQIKNNVFPSSDTAQTLARSALTPSPLEKAKNGRTHRYAPTDERWRCTLIHLSETMPFHQV